MYSISEIPLDLMVRILSCVARPDQTNCVSRSFHFATQTAFRDLQLSYQSSTIIRPFSPNRTGLLNNEIVERTVTTIFQKLKARQIPIIVDDISSSSLEAMIREFNYYNLIELYESLPIDNKPNLTGSQLARATSIASWMNQNQHLLRSVVLLDLSNLSLSALPQEINFLSELQDINLSHNDITILPNNLNLPQLEELDLSNTGISVLPNSFYLPNLKQLNLSHTNLSAIPSSLNLPRLNELDLCCTKISAIPTTLNTPRLKHLYLSASLISSIPENFNLQDLEDLALDYTLITELPDTLNLPSLQRLYLRHTSITRLPASLNSLTNLEIEI